MAAERAPIVRMATAPDGLLTYLVDITPGDLPAVRGRDLLAAWDHARAAAQRAAWGKMRAFRFRRTDGGWTDIVLHDRDAQCWAGAVDDAVGMRTGYGLSVCLRLLALVDLLARAGRGAGLMSVGRPTTSVHPAVLKLAAETQLTDDARFDETIFRERLGTVRAFSDQDGASTP